MNIQEGGRENAAVFWLLSHRSSVAGSSASQMTERERKREREKKREREMHVWDLKGTASGCLGYLFLSKAMRCLVKGGKLRCYVENRQHSFTLFPSRLQPVVCKCENMSSPLTC